MALNNPNVQHNYSTDTTSKNVVDQTWQVDYGETLPQLRTTYENNRLQSYLRASKIFYFTMKNGVPFIHYGLTSATEQDATIAEYNFFKKKHNYPYAIFHDHPIKDFAASELRMEKADEFLVHIRDANVYDALVSFKKINFQNEEDKKEILNLALSMVGRSLPHSPSLLLPYMKDKIIALIDFLFLNGATPNATLNGCSVGRYMNPAGFSRLLELGAEIRPEDLPSCRKYGCLAELPDQEIVARAVKNYVQAETMKKLKREKALKKAGRDAVKRFIQQHQLAAKKTVFGKYLLVLLFKCDALCDTLKESMKDGWDNLKGR